MIHEHSSLLPRAVASATSTGAPSSRRRPRRRGPSLREDIWTVLHFRTSLPHRSGLQFASYVLEVCILTLILLNVILAIKESSRLVGSPAPERSQWYETFLLISTVIFSIEYVLRLWSCVEDPRYRSPILGRLIWMTRPMSLIDLLSLIPFYLELCFEYIVVSSYTGALTLRSLRLLRIISFLRLERSYSAMRSLRLIFANKKEEMLVVSYLTALLVVTSSTMIFFLENTAQPDVFSSIGVSAWWAVETISSLGYGDIVPQTTAGRLFSAVLALWGIILFTIPGAILSSAFIEVMLDKQRQEEEDALSSALRGSWDTGLTHANGDVDTETNAPSSPPALSTSHSFRRLSPRVVSAMRLEHLAQKMDDLAFTQRQMQQEMKEQREQLTEIRRLLQQLATTRGSSPPESSCQSSHL